MTLDVDDARAGNGSVRTIVSTPLHLVDGRWEQAGDTAVPIVDPATSARVGELPVATNDQVARACIAARRATSWERVDPAARAECLKEWARRIRGASEGLAAAQTTEMGRTLGSAREAARAGAATVEQFAELGPLHRGRALQGRWDSTDAMIHVPRGVAALLTPWNDPVPIACQLLAANLVAGNTVVWKPSEHAALSAHLLVEMLADLVPPGVLNVVHGDGVTGSGIVGRDEIDLVCHVGSTASGATIAARCASRFVKTVLELGGNDPLIVDRGVDPEWAAAQAALGCFANGGQICTSIERVYVHREVAADFVDALVAAAEALRVGDGRDPATEMGPLAFDAIRASVHRDVVDARRRGAICRAGGVVPPGPGFFYPPTVVTEVTPQMRLMRFETFGPVAPVQVVGAFDEAVALANATDHGLAATVLTPDLEVAQRAVRELRAGTVKVNAVFGGAPGGAATPCGCSGMGFGYGPELLDEITATRVVHISSTGRPV